MTPKEAQSLAERFVNMHRDNITIKELKQALVVLANYYEDHRNIGYSNRGYDTEKELKCRKKI